MLKDKKPFWKSKTIGAIGALVITDIVTNPPLTKQDALITSVKIGLGILGAIFRTTATKQL